MSLTTREMEVRLAKYFNYLRVLIVPNISWGMGVHECDLFIVSNSGYITEVEIKISKQDLIKDINKRHKHSNVKIKKLYFAIPESLLSYISHIPEKAGIIIVAEKQIYRDGFKRGMKIVREPLTNKEAKPLSMNERYKVVRLGTMRIWSLKDKIIKIKK